ADGFGDPSAQLLACAAPPGSLADNTDCDDADATVHPGGTEVCFGADEDCDGLVDEADPDTQLSSWYDDSDGDGYGNLIALRPACAAPTGTVADATDCNDGDSAIHPTAPEACGGVDLDCDGLVDEQDPDTVLSDWYPDQDGDSVGDDAGLLSACVGPPGSVATGGDCRDTDPAVGACTLYTLGNATDLGDFLTLSPDELHLQKLSLSTAGTLLAMGALQDHATGEMILTLYSDASGSPDQLLLATPPTPVHSGAQEINVPATSLSAGDYWVGATWDTEVTVRSAAGTLLYGSTLYTWGDSLPDPLTGITPATGPDLNLYLILY
ncbi:MAG TPA: putative metal-binding motif-containing protein, partial [Myxococcota bacterium]|nr:putative metal-binding motif-containing protein [Myxococcota bacterium]